MTSPNSKTKEKKIHAKKQPQNILTQFVCFYLDSLFIFTISLNDIVWWDTAQASKQASEQQVSDRLSECQHVYSRLINIMTEYIICIRYNKYACILSLGWRQNRLATIIIHTAVLRCIIYFPTLADQNVRTNEKEEENNKRNDELKEKHNNRAHSTISYIICSVSCIQQPSVAVKLYQ